MKFTQSLTLSPKHINALLKQQGTTTMRPQIPTQPSQGNVPWAWANTYMPPGVPITPLYPMGQDQNGRGNQGWQQHAQMEPQARSRILSTTQTGTIGTTPIYSVTDEQNYMTRTDDLLPATSYRPQFTPRSFQFPPNVNSTIIPRSSYALAPFYEIQAISESTPEVIMCLRLLKRIFLSLVPTVKHKDGEACNDPALTHLIEYPDGYHSMSQWLSRWFYNGLIYDANALHMTRDVTGLINGLVNVDGSTIFLLVDENGNEPEPPAPAYIQIIWGTPYGFASTEQLWYKPQDLHPNAPYGTPIYEAVPQIVNLLNLFWQYELSEFTVGNMPETAYTAPPQWSPDQIAQWLITKNQALAGNPGLRKQFDVWPDGFKELQTKDPKFRQEMKTEATRVLLETASLPLSEIGVTGGAGLGGKGFMDAMQMATYRQSIAPWMKATAQPFNDVFNTNHQKCSHGKDYHYLDWDFPQQSIDPEKEQEKLTAQFINGGMTWGAYREAIGQTAFGDERDDLTMLPKGAQLIRPDGTTFAGGMPDMSAFGDEGGAGDKGNGKDAAKPNGMGGKKPAVKKLGAGFTEGGIELLDLAKAHSGVIVALQLDAKTAENLQHTIKTLNMLPAEVDMVPLSEMHITLAYLGDAKDLTLTPDTLLALLQVFASKHAPLRGKLGGIAQFNPNPDGEMPVVALFDCPELAAFHHDLLDMLTAADVPLEKEHGFTAHITLAYLSEGKKIKVAGQPQMSIAFEEICLAWADKWTSVPLAMNKNGWAGAIGYDIYTEGGTFIEHVNFEKHCGVCSEDDSYFGAPLSRGVTINMPHEGVNGSEIVSAAWDGLEPRAFVFKPEGDEDEAYTAAIGHPQYVAEAATYLIDRALDFYLVPVAYVTEVNDERGAAIMYVRDSMPPKPALNYANEWVERATVLDWITGQTDRLHHNWLTHPDDALRPILFDNGLSFPTKASPRAISSAFVNAWRGKPMTADVSDAVRMLASNAGVWAQVAKLVGADAAGEAQLRAMELVGRGEIPN